MPLRLRKDLTVGVFDTDDRSWSMWTKLMENSVGNPTKPLVVQSPTILTPLTPPKTNDEDHQKLFWYRKLTIGDGVPSYSAINDSTYSGASLRRVSSGYRLYLHELNLKAQNDSPAASRSAIENAYKIYTAAQQNYSRFRSEAAVSWRKAKSANPALKRDDWEATYLVDGIDFRAALRERTDAVARTYGAYRSLAMPYPQLLRVTEALARAELSIGAQVSLPESEDDLMTGAEGWGQYYKTNIDLGIDWSEFLSTDAVEARSLTETSTVSEYYNSRWSAGGNVSVFGFFKTQGGVNGGTVESHLRSDTRSITFTFKRLVAGNVTRSTWFDGGLLESPYRGWVKASDYWGPRGQLCLIPLNVVIGRLDRVTILTSATATDSFNSWRTSEGAAGFSVGPWRIGGSAGSSTNWGKVQFSASGDSISIVDNSNVPYLFSVVSQKMDESDPIGLVAEGHDAFLERLRSDERVYDATRHRVTR